MKKTIEMLKNVGAILNAPASDDLLRKIEGKYQISIPPGARDIYKEANGANGAFGNWMWQFWPIDSDEIRLSDYFKRPRKYRVEGRNIDPRKYLRFFDALIDCPLYAYCADSESEYFGEILGILSDGGRFKAFVSASSAATFLSLLTATKADDTVINQ